MKSSGYRVKSTVAQLQQEALILWGRQDRILSADYLERYVSTAGPQPEDLTPTPGRPAFWVARALLETPSAPL